MKTLFPSPLRASVQISFACFCWCLCCSVQAAEISSTSVRYAQLYERELAGDVRGALSGYRGLLPEIPSDSQLLSEKILYRIGVCERRLGNSELARKAWRDLVESFPAADRYVAGTREALKTLERELDRMIVVGKIESGIGSPLANGPVMVGEWGNEPPVISGTSGCFRVERKVAGRMIEGTRYCFVYAEHPTLPLSTAVIGREMRSPAASNSNQQPVTVTQCFDIHLAPSLSLSGRVIDSSGRPVGGALIRVMGFEMGSDKQDEESDIPLPLDRILPPSLSSTNGDFMLTGLPANLRYILTAEKTGWKMVKAGEKYPAPAPKGEGMSAPSPFRGEGGGEGVSFFSVGSIVLQSLGEISLQGRVLDESGVPVRADVAVYSLSPAVREVVRASTDGDGRFLFRDLRENLVTLKVTGDDCRPRSLSGLKPMGQDVDIVVKSDPAALPRKDGPRGISPKKLQSETSPPGYPAWVSTPTSILPLFSSLNWVRGNTESGEPLKWEDVKGRIVVLHFGSAYVESSLRSQYPGDPGVLSQMMKLYGDKGLMCIWVLPEGEGQGDAARMALELYPDLPVGVSGQKSEVRKQRSENRGQIEDGGQGGGALLPVSLMPLGGDIVVGRDGLMQAVCSDQQLFKAVKRAVLSR